MLLIDKYTPDDNNNKKYPYSFVCGSRKYYMINKSKDISNIKINNLNFFLLIIIMLYI